MKESTVKHCKTKIQKQKYYGVNSSPKVELSETLELNTNNLKFDNDFTEGMPAILANRTVSKTEQSWQCNPTVFCESIPNSKRAVLSSAVLQSLIEDPLQSCSTYSKKKLGKIDFVHSSLLINEPTWAVAYRRSNDHFPPGHRAHANHCVSLWESHRFSIHCTFHRKQPKCIGFLDLQLRVCRFSLILNPGLSRHCNPLWKSYVFPGNTHSALIANNFRSFSKSCACKWLQLKTKPICIQNPLHINDKIIFSILLRSQFRIVKLTLCFDKTIAKRLGI